VLRYYQIRDFDILIGHTVHDMVFGLVAKLAINFFLAKSEICGGLKPG